MLFTYCQLTDNGGGGNEKTAVHDPPPSLSLPPFLPKPWQMYSYKDGTALFGSVGGAQAGRQDPYLLSPPPLNWKDNWHQKGKMGPV